MLKILTQFFFHAVQWVKSFKVFEHPTYASDLWLCCSSVSRRWVSWWNFQPKWDVNPRFFSKRRPSGCKLQGTNDYLNKFVRSRFFVSFFRGKKPQKKGMNFSDWKFALAAFFALRFVPMANLRPAVPFAVMNCESKAQNQGWWISWERNHRMKKVRPDEMSRKIGFWRVRSVRCEYVGSLNPLLLCIARSFSIFFGWRSTVTFFWGRYHFTPLDPVRFVYRIQVL